MAQKRHRVCATSELTQGDLKAVKVGRATVVLTRLESGEVRAISGRCPHHGAALEFGCLTGRAHSDTRETISTDRPGEILRCPWHGFEFDLVSGDPLVPGPAGRAMRLRFYKVEENDGAVHVIA